MPISAEYGRFSGGVVNMITKSGGNAFSGSFRTNFSNDAWTQETPFEESRNVDRKAVFVLEKPVEMPEGAVLTANPPREPIHPPVTRRGTPTRERGPMKTFSVNIDERVDKTLEELRRRLANDEQSERAEVTEQLAQITRLRLELLLAE